ncbi:30S ribosomal protein S17e [archaeon]|jgi:small subunit ribosomal protein S17e|nr:30S ribosomal protein S17e [archaeon]MBT4647941.1 30S ribosomal protein S17e [archaeon]MBT7393175.1 30S ribosomal protein S17e [archaeon]
MGRIKTKKIKSITEEFIEVNSDLKSSNFEENKKLVSEKTDVTSKKLRNIIAGYASRLNKTDEK